MDSGSSHSRKTPDSTWVSNSENLAISVLFIIFVLRLVDDTDRGPYEWASIGLFARLLSSAFSQCYGEDNHFVDSSTTPSLGTYSLSSVAFSRSVTSRDYDTQHC
jgi:hypothetical protein